MRKFLASIVVVVLASLGGGALNMAPAFAETCVRHSPTINDGNFRTVGTYTTTKTFTSAAGRSDGQVRISETVQYTTVFFGSAYVFSNVRVTSTSWTPISGILHPANFPTTATGVAPDGSSFLADVVWPFNRPGEPSNFVRVKLDMVVAGEFLDPGSDPTHTRYTDRTETDYDESPWAC